MSLNPIPGLNPQPTNLPPSLAQSLQPISPAQAGLTEAQLAALTPILDLLGLKPLGLYQEKPAAPVAVKTKGRQIQDDLGRSFGFIQTGHQAIKGAIATGNVPAFNNGLNLLAIGLEGYLKAVKAAEPEGSTVSRVGIGTPMQRLENTAKGVVGGIQRGEYRRY